MDNPSHLKDISGIEVDKAERFPYVNYKINSPTLRKIISKIYPKFHGDARKFLLKHMLKHSICAEIGIYKGDFSKQILKKVKPKKLHLIDINTSILSNDLNNYENVTIHEGDSKTILSEFEDDYFDWVYIDADHSYSAVKSDLELCRKKVKNGGFITGDDYKNHHFGVIKAVTEFLEHNPEVQLIEIKESQFILRKKIR